MAGKRKRDREADTNQAAEQANADPISGAPGSHPVGTAIGAATGGAAGAAIGSAVPGPGTAVGAAVGAVVGAVAGGLAGKGVAEAVNPTEEEAYWREHYRHRPYIQPGADYELYEPAYRYGYSSYAQHPGQQFEDVESDLQRDWEQARGQSKLEWEQARHATRDAWQRVRDRLERAAPGDADRDCK
ncbi:glycine zipper domain-containing protein [Fontivita pretiosa]|uniref:glycine zipper domain-containing protein n=1 Tax=Fontivita pretiosa TaxID=2989684 RepID=UPI003D1824CE